MSNIFTWATLLSWIVMSSLAFSQNTAFSLVSRSRNRNDMRYHLIAAVFSNAVWFCTFRYLVTSKMDWILFIPYTFGTVSGSIFGVKISMQIEKWLGAASDSHLKTEEKTCQSKVTSPIVDTVSLDSLPATSQPKSGTLTETSDSRGPEYTSPRLVQPRLAVRGPVEIHPSLATSK